MWQINVVSFTLISLDCPTDGTSIFLVCNTLIFSYFESSFSQIGDVTLLGGITRLGSNDIFSHGHSCLWDRNSSLKKTRYLSNINAIKVRLLLHR